MTETERTVYPGTAKVRHLLYADKAAAQLPPWWAVVRIAEDGETPDLTPSETVAGGVFHMATWSLDSDPGTVLAEAARDALAIDAHRAEAASKAEAPRVEVTDEMVQAMLDHAEAEDRGVWLQLSHDYARSLIAAALAASPGSKPDPCSLRVGKRVRVIEAPEYPNVAGMPATVLNLGAGVAAPHPLDGLGVGSIAMLPPYRAFGDEVIPVWRCFSDGWSMLPVAGDRHAGVDGTTMRRDGWTILHREPATPEPEPGPDPRRPDLREGMVVTDEPPRGWEVAVDPGAGNLMHGAKGWSSERLGAGGVPWIDMRCTYERLTLVAFHPEHAGLDPEPSPVRDVQVGDRS